MLRTPEENLPSVSTKVPDPNEQYLNKDNLELKGSFKTLQDSNNDRFAPAFQPEVCFLAECAWTFRSQNS